MKAVISDGQRSIRLAVKQEFPGVPHQLCHFHFLRNITKPIADLDRALKVDLKKKVRGIKPVEQKVANKKEEDKQSTLIYDYCQTIRFALQNDGCYPLDPGGLKLYTRLNTIRQSIDRNNKHHPNTELQKLFRILSILDVLESRYRQVKRLYRWVFRVNRVLKQNKSKKHQKSSAQVEAELLVCFDKLLKLRPRCLVDRLAVENILKFMASYWEGLFYRCCRLIG